MCSFLSVSLYCFVFSNQEIAVEIAVEGVFAAGEEEKVAGRGGEEKEEFEGRWWWQRRWRWIIV